MSQQPLHIVALSGSLRKQSYNTKLLHNAAQFLPPNLTFTLADLSQIPMYNEDLESDLPQAVTQFAELCRSADGVLISTPEYNGQISGVLKNALDWVSRAYLLTPLALKPVAIMGATKGNGGTSQAQTNLRQLLFSLNMEPVNRPVLQVSQAHTKFDEAGQFTDAHGKEILEKLVHNLAAKVVKHKNEQQEAAASASR